MKDIHDIVREWKRRRGHAFALATLVRAQGSSYRRPGARMLIDHNGHIIGSLSAGCLENEITTTAREVLETGEPVVTRFDTRRWFGCNGKIDVLIERAREDFFRELAWNLEARRTCLAITVFEGMDLGTMIGSFESECHCDLDGKLVQEIHPTIRLLIFGDGPDNAPIRRLSELLGWESLGIVDPNVIVTELDQWTAAIVKSHNYGRDFAALQKLLPLNLRYVGLIGPRKRRDQLLNELLGLGMTINAGFYAPAGLDLQSETPEEIALAIVAEIQRAFAGGSGFSLREKRTPIHRASSHSIRLASLPLTQPCVLAGAE
jgi:xanthine dehydrogenase accessory factor